MYINTIYQQVQLLANKDQRGELTPDQFNLGFALASQFLYTQRLGLPEGYRMGDPVPKIAYAQTELIELQMSPFLSDPTHLNVDATGRATRPTDLALIVSIGKEVPTSQTTSEWGAINIVPQINLAYRRSSKVAPPNQKCPICSIYSTYLQFYPKNILGVSLVYLRMPAEAVWGWTENDGEPVFDPAASIDTDWPPTTHPMLVARVLEYFQINIRDVEMIGITENMKNTGE